MPNSQDHYRFESGWIVKLFAGIVIAGIVALGIVAFVTGNGVAVGLLIVLIVAGATGLILERIDSGRKREPGDDGAKDDYWGFRGRPGAYTLETEHSRESNLAGAIIGAAGGLGVGILGELLVYVVRQAAIACLRSCRQSAKSSN